jgi:hypothetical protein
LILADEPARPKTMRVQPYTLSGFLSPKRTVLSEAERRRAKAERTQRYRRNLKASGAPENRVIAEAILAAAVTHSPSFSETDHGILADAMRMLVKAGYDAERFVERLRKLRDRLSPT